MKSPGCVGQGGKWWVGTSLSEPKRDVPSLGVLFEAAWVWFLSADVLSPRAKSVAGTGPAEPLECRSLGKSGHSGCYEVNLASIKASFRAAKPFPYVSLWELQSSGEGLGGRQAETRWPHPGALYKPVVWPAQKWVPDPAW